MTRYKAIIEYDGADYCGMQKQKDCHGKTIQSVLEEAITKFANKKTTIDYSGRTDSGVHALGQVIHFDLEDDREEYKVLRGVNFYLVNKNVILKEVEKVNQDFHARFSAKSRVYIYRVLNSKTQSPLSKNRTFYYPYDININRMIEASKIFLGEKMDFSSFCSAESVDKVNTMKTINRIDIYKQFDVCKHYQMGSYKEWNSNEIIFEFEAKSFLHNMIRIMVGVLLNVGRGKINIEDVKRILLQKKRPDNCDTAPAHGLYFAKVNY